MSDIPEPRRISYYDVEKLHRLYKEYQEAPVVKLFGTYDVHKEAQDRFFDYMKHLAEKYEFDLTTHSLNHKGEIVKIPKEKV